MLTTDHGNGPLGSTLSRVGTRATSPGPMAGADGFGMHPHLNPSESAVAGRSGASHSSFHECDCVASHSSQSEDYIRGIHSNIYILYQNIR